MSDRKTEVADAVKALVQSDKGRTVSTALDAVHTSRRDPLRFIQPTRLPHDAR